MGMGACVDINGNLGPSCRVLSMPSQVLSTDRSLAVVPAQCRACSSWCQALRPSCGPLPCVPLPSADMFLRPGA